MTPNNDSNEKVYRAALLINYAQQSRVLKIGLEYLRNLMTNKDHYSDVLVDLYLSELEQDWNDFYQLHLSEFQELNQLSIVISDPKIGDLDRHYLTQVEYIPIRAKLENAFTAKLASFSSKYSVDFKAKDFWDRKLICESLDPITSGNDIARRIRKRIFRSLTLEYDTQLTTLEPYSSHFRDAKSRRKILERIISGITDFEFFRYRYDLPSNQKTYLSAFAQSLDDLICWMRRNNRGKFELVDSLWKLYTALLTAIEMSSRFEKFSDGSKKAETDDPNVYSSFLKAKSNLSLKKEEVDEYLCYIETYNKACEQIAAAIESIVPILNEQLNSRRLPTPSSARRKITAPEPIQKYNATMQEIYANFASLSSSVKIQKSILDQILIA